MRYDLMAVIGVPLVMWVVCLGCGLALERILRLRLENALLLPLGLCVAFVLIFPGYVAGASDVLAVALLVIVGPRWPPICKGWAARAPEPGLGRSGGAGRLCPLHAAGDRLRPLDVVGL